MNEHAKDADGPARRKGDAGRRRILKPRPRWFMKCQKAAGHEEEVSPEKEEGRGEDGWWTKQETEQTPTSRKKRKREQKGKEHEKVTWSNGRLAGKSDRTLIEERR